MNSQLSGKQLLDQIAEGLSVFFSALLQTLFGPRVLDPVVAGFSWADGAVLLFFILVVVLVNRLAASFLHRKFHRADAPPETQEWHRAVLYAVAGPLYLLIWIYGIYFAFTPILLKLRPEEGEHAVRFVFDRVFGFAVFTALVWLFFRLTYFIEGRLKVWAARSEGTLDDLLAPMLGRTLRVIIPVIAIILALPVVDLPLSYSSLISKGSSILLIVAVAWIIFQAIGLGERMILARYDITQADNLEARKIHTQVRVLGRTAYVLVGIFTIASVLMLFDEVRRLGASILASAGVLGIIVGFAAQRTIANLFAGFQIAMTQPIRLDDAVIVEGEMGRVEEITLTYVVLKLWDQRRLIVPLSYFIEKPFQNWTRVSAELLGSVFLYADYSVPLDKVRAAVKSIVENSPLWDKKFWNLQVTDATDRALQIRILVTAASAPAAWELRCEVREKLIAFIQERCPESLPKVRAELNGEPWKRLPAQKRQDAASE